MANAIEGTITCPHCGNRDATVHREARGKRALYYRCYESAGSVAMRCGTVQIRGPKGQEWIAANMHREQPEAANDPIAPLAPVAPTREPANDPIADEKPARRSGVVGRFLASFNDEE